MGRVWFPLLSKPTDLFLVLSEPQGLNLGGSWQPTPAFLPGEFHGQRAWQATVHGITRVGHDLATKPPYTQITQDAEV